MIRTKLLNFTEDLILENDFVRLTPLRLEHVFPLSKISNDPEIWKYFFEKGDTLEPMITFVADAVKNRRLEKEYTFAIYDKQKAQYAGTTRFYEYSKVLKTIKLGHTWYGKLFRGSGINKHSKQLLFDYAFKKIGLERIDFSVHTENYISIFALVNLGCKREGVLRNMFPSIDKKGRADAILMSILKADWYKQINPELTLTSRL